MPEAAVEAVSDVLPAAATRVAGDSLPERIVAATQPHILAALLSDECVDTALDAFLAASLSGPGSARKHARERVTAALQAVIDHLGAGHE